MLAESEALGAGGTTDTALAPASGPHAADATAGPTDFDPAGSEAVSEAALPGTVAGKGSSQQADEGRIEACRAHLPSSTTGAATHQCRAHLRALVRAALRDLQHWRLICLAKRVPTTAGAPTTNTATIPPGPTAARVTPRTGSGAGGAAAAAPDAGLDGTVAADAPMRSGGAAAQTTAASLPAGAGPTSVPRPPTAGTITSTGNAAAAPGQPRPPFRWLVLKPGLPLDEPADILCLPFGFAVFKSGFPPQQAYALAHALLQASGEGLDLSDELHLSLLLTQSMNLSATQARDAATCFASILADHKHAYKPLLLRGLGLVKVSPHSIRDVDSARARESARAAQAASAEEVRLGKLRSALVLTLVLHEVPLEYVCSTFSIERGDVQRLQTDAASHAGMVCALVGQLPGLEVLHRVLQRFAERLEFGVQPELLPLMVLPEMTPMRARNLHRAGYEGVEDVADATPEHVCNALSKHHQFHRTGDQSADAIGGSRLASTVPVASKQELLALSRRLVAAAGSIVKERAALQGPASGQ